MQISTMQIYDRSTSLMSKLVKQADNLQTQIATGKRFTAASADPVAYQRVERLKRDGANDATYASNIKMAQGLLAQSDTTYAAVETQLVRAKELALQAGNETLSGADRNAIATAFEGLVEDLLLLVNTKDTRGTPIFGGATGDTAYARQLDGTIAFVGVGQPASIPIGEGATVQPTDNGERIFGGIEKADATETDIFAILQSMAAALRTEDPDEDGAMSEGLDGITASLDNVIAARSSVGARAYRMDFEADRLVDIKNAREETRSGIEDIDATTAIAELQKTMTVLQATQASFTKLSQLSLFDYLR